MISGAYQVVFRARFERTFKRLDARTKREIVRAVEELADDPFGSANVRKIAGVRQPGYRLRVGRWRVIYLLITARKTIEVLDLFMKKSPSDYRDY